jgi:hypothetical protein
MLNPICRGLVGYISYLATCRTATVYSEYLYEPLVRIAKSQGYDVSAEVKLKKRAERRGDHERIDFRLERGEELLGLEVKWIKSHSPPISKDVRKLRTFKKEKAADGQAADGYVLLFGRSKFFDGLKPQGDDGQKFFLVERRCVRWDAGKTDYSATWLKII